MNIQKWFVETTQLRIQLTSHRGVAARREKIVLFGFAVALFLGTANLTTLQAKRETTHQEAVEGNSGTLTLSKVYFVNTSRGLVLGSTSDQGFVFQSADGGTSWQERYRGKVGLFNIKFANEKVGWIVGSSGTILRTSDGGSTWQPQVTETNVSLTGLAVLDANSAWASGGLGTLLHTTNGGKSWLKREVNTQVGISDVAFVDSKHGWAVGYGTILSTVNGGDTWQIRSSGHWKPLTSVSFADENLGWITVGPIILKTTDGGEHWSEVLPPSEGQLVGLSFIDSRRGWVVKSQGQEGSVIHIPGRDRRSSESFVLSTTDGGYTWENVFRFGNQTDHSAWLLNIFFTDPMNGWAVGRQGLVMKTVDSGRTWDRTQLMLTASARLVQRKQ